MRRCRKAGGMWAAAGISADSRHETLDPAGDKEEQDADGAGNRNDLEKPDGHGLRVVAADFPGEQAGEKVPEGGTEEPDSHHLADESGRSEFGDGAQADRAEE